jgi:hypothetical protein
LSRGTLPQHTVPIPMGDPRGTSDESAAVRSSVARVGGFAKAAKYRPEELTRGARAGFISKFEREALEDDPTLKDDLTELARRSEALMRAQMGRMAIRSAKARRAKKAR